MLTPLEDVKCKVELVALRLAGMFRPGARKVVQMAGVPLQMPIGHQLPVYRRYFPLYDGVISRLAALVAAKYPGCCTIDVGANIGDTLALIKAGARVPVLCVEGDPAFFSLLEANARQFDSVALANAFLGEARQSLPVSLSNARGTGELIPSSSETAFEPLDELLARFPDFKRSKLLKIDTDGFDNAILRGAGELLRDANPVVFFEYMPDVLLRNGDDGLSIFEFLKERGYARMLVYSNLGELVCEVGVGDRRNLEMLRSFQLGKGIRSYFDLCVFSERDRDLFDSFAAAEIEYAVGRSKT